LIYEISKLSLTNPWFTIAVLQRLRDQLAELQQQLESQAAAGAAELAAALAERDGRVAAAEAAREDMRLRLGLMEQQLAALRAARAKKVPQSDVATQTDPPEQAPPPPPAPPAAVPVAVRPAQQVVAAVVEREVVQPVPRKRLVSDG
jgi:hypothetical protein